MIQLHPRLETEEATPCRKYPSFQLFFARPDPRVFLKSSCTAWSDLGCRVSGVTFLHPCRARRRYTVDLDILRPTACSYATCMGDTSKTPPFSASFVQESRKARSSSKLISWFRRPPRFSAGSLGWPLLLRNSRRKTQTDLTWSCLVPIVWLSWWPTLN